MNTTDQNPGPITSKPTTNPADYWRRLCRVADSPVYVCGDLPHDDTKAEEQLDGWVAEGIDGIVDVRIEWDDQDRVKQRHPHVNYIWNGVDDAGGQQAFDWFDFTVDQTLKHLQNPDSKVVVHCHMGINRGPSMAFAILLALGWKPIDALNAIRHASNCRHHLRRLSTSLVARAQRQRRGGPGGRPREALPLAVRQQHQSRHAVGRESYSARRGRRLKLQVRIGSPMAAIGRSFR